jgi:hypothetical protein
MMPSPPRPRWRLRLTVKALLALVLVIGVLLGWLVHRAKVQRDAVSAIRAAGGHVTYDFEKAQWSGKSGGISPGPEWLVDILGVDFLANVIQVSFREAQSDEVLAQVGRLHKLERLDAQTTHITDVGLAHLAGLSELRSLSCMGSPGLTDAGLAALAGMRQLESLWIDDTSGVQGPGLSHLAELDRLTELVIHTETNAGLPYLARHVRLRKLFLDTEEVSDETLAQLAKLTWLEELALIGESGSDAGTAQLGSLSKLKTLQVSGPWFTDAGLDPISEMDNLSQFFVSDVTSVTPAGLNQLQRRRPTLRIGVNGTGWVDRAHTDLLRRAVGPGSIAAEPQ